MVNLVCPCNTRLFRKTLLSMPSRVNRFKAGANTESLHHSGDSLLDYDLKVRGAYKYLEQTVDLITVESGPQRNLNSDLNMPSSIWRFAD